jgi:hypothetical protein
MVDSADAFDFYPCLVDDAPASIYVNLRYEHDQLAFDTRYTVAIRMREPDTHGIGTNDETGALNLVEEAAIATARELGVTFVGRIRTRGIWEIVLYGPPGHVDALHAVAHERVGDRRIEVRSAADPTWIYYRELLLPDAERRQWMDDRRLVQVLREQGDVLVTPRRVDHWASFATAAARDAFIAAVTGNGFALAEAFHDTDDTERPFGAWIHRIDSIELDHIHDVVMTLVDAALANAGTYDGWETSIEG